MKSAIGAVVRAARLRKGLSQVELAERSGVKRDYISSIESNRIAVVYPESANRLRDALEFKGWQLLEAMGYETDVSQYGVSAPLLAKLAELSDGQQFALLNFLESLTPQLAAERSN